jgi:hypothetical protein
MIAAEEARSRAPVNRWVIAIELSILAFIGAAMLAWTWRTWPSPATDFGRELYVPWQLTEGKVLYRDIAYFNGPLSPYLNAIVFRIGGVSLMSLVWANVVVLAVVVVLLHRLTAQMSDEFSATVACAAFLILLAIGEPGPAAGCNFISPYSHEMTHGMLLALGTLACLWRSLLTPPTPTTSPPPVLRGRVWRGFFVAWVGAAGVCFGATFLTKPEIFAALAVACGTYFVLIAVRDQRLQAIVIPSVVFVCAALVPIVIALLVLCRAMPFSRAVNGVIGAWRWAGDPAISDSYFYRLVRGTDDAAESLRLIGVFGIGYVIALLIPFGIALLVRRSQMKWLSPVVFVVFGSAALYAIWQVEHWDVLGRPLIVFAIVLPVALLVVYVRTRERTPRQIFQLTFAAFALVLLAKIYLNVRLYHYGFALALPVMVLCLMTFVCWLPRWLESRNHDGWIVRAAMLAMTCALCARYLSLIHRRLQTKTYTIATGGDRFYTNSRAVGFNELSARLDALPPNATLACIPEGAMLNYLARRENPTGHVSVMPPEITMFGDEDTTADFSRNPPDVMVLKLTDFSEYGVNSIGDYAPKLVSWLVDHYSITARGRNPDFQYSLLTRNR